MKKYILFFFCLLSAHIASAQSPLEIRKQQQEKYEEELKDYNRGLVDTSHRYFYKTYENYINEKPETSLKYTGKRKVTISGESVLVLENDEFNYKKIKELNYWGFIDEYGQLERIFDNHCYYVTDSGQICSYVKAIDVEMSSDKNGNLSFNWFSENIAGNNDYISSGLNAKITEFSDKLFESLTSSKPGIYEDYKKEKSASTSGDRRTAKTMKIKKFVHLYNQP